MKLRYTEALGQQWENEFLKSEFHDSLTKTQKAHADFIVNTFLEYMTRGIEEPIPAEWTSQEVEDVFLDYAPRKISAETELFECYGPVVISFLKFLQETGKTPVNPSLIKTAQDLKHKIVEAANNPSNWGIAKGFMMGAKNSGVDLSSKEAIDKYLQEQQLEALNKLKQKRQEEEANKGKRRKIHKIKKRKRRRK